MAIIGNLAPTVNVTSSGGGFKSPVRVQITPNAFFTSYTCPAGRVAHLTLNDTYYAISSGITSYRNSTANYSVYLGPSQTIITSGFIIGYTVAF